MGIIISSIGQKGGPGKSTLSRALATCYAQANWDVKIADLDINQSTSFEWHRDRIQNNIKPELAVEVFGTAAQALKQADNYDLLIVDGAPTASRTTTEVCLASDLVVITTGPALDDLRPSVRIAHNLCKQGVEAKRIVFVLNKANCSETELSEIREYLSETPYLMIDGQIDFKSSYRQAQNKGLSIIESNYKTTREKAGGVIQNIINHLEQLTK